MNNDFLKHGISPDNKILAYDWLAHHALHRGDKTAIIDLAAGNHYSYQEFNQRASRLANYLREISGVKKGDRVAILAKNGNEYLEFYYACNKLGAISVLLNWRLSVSELDYILNDCTPNVLLYDLEFKSQIDKLTLSYELNEFIEIHHGEENCPYEQALKQSAADFVRTEDIELTDIQSIMYTSGTTGKPKGAMITHRMTLFNAINLSNPATITVDSVNLVLMPLFHTGGLNCYTNPIIHSGGTNIIMREFEPRFALQTLANPVYGITHTLGVPSVYQFIDQLPEFATTKFPTLKTVGVGGAPLPLATLSTWAERGFPLQQGFGMTETSPTCLILSADKAIEKTGSVGLPALHNEVRIVSDDGTDVAPGEIGELWVKGPNVCPGYWQKPEANQSSFTDGWLHTGDAARQDDDGYYYIVDRWKDMYISGGENVYPAEVEAVIYEIEGVAEAAVIGVADAKWGEVGNVFVVNKPGASLTEEAVLGYCAQKLAKFKVPVYFNVIDALPRNATGKVLKRELVKED